MPVIAVSAVPLSRDGFYATNNQFQINGPRGFTEFRMLENDDLFVRMDLPGVPKDGVRCLVDKSKKAVVIVADAPKEHKHDSAGRRYGAATGLVCECCEISGIQSHMSDGVLRLVLSKKKIDERRPSCISFLRDTQGRRGTDPLDPAWTGRVIQPHPNVMEGSSAAFESKQLQNGGLYLRLDMPGVPKDRFGVAVEDGAVKVIGRAPAVGFDSSGRDYGGKVALLTCPDQFPSRRIKTVAKNGVIRLIIPPV